MKKIVILGALGYLGTELSRIYSGESWKNKIIAIDSRFISERINQLKKWNIEFFQGHILDTDFAVETTKLTRTQILQQAATSMLAQSNASKQSVLALLQNLG